MESKATDREGLSPQMMWLNPCHLSETSRLADLGVAFQPQLMSILVVG